MFFRQKSIPELEQEAIHILQMHINSFALISNEEAARIEPFEYELVHLYPDPKIPFIKDGRNIDSIHFYLAVSQDQSEDDESDSRRYIKNFKKSIILIETGGFKLFYKFTMKDLQCKKMVNIIKNQIGAFTIRLHRSRSLWNMRYETLLNLDVEEVDWQDFKYEPEDKAFYKDYREDVMSRLTDVLDFENKKIRIIVLGCGEAHEAFLTAKTVNDFGGVVHSVLCIDTNKSVLDKARINIAQAINDEIEHNNQRKQWGLEGTEVNYSLDHFTFVHADAIQWDFPRCPDPNVNTLIIAIGYFTSQTVKNSMTVLRTLQKLCLNGAYVATGGRTSPLHTEQNDRAIGYKVDLSTANITIFERGGEFVKRQDKIPTYILIPDLLEETAIRRRYNVETQRMDLAFSADPTNVLFSFSKLCPKEVTEIKSIDIRLCYLPDNKVIDVFYKQLVNLKKLQKQAHPMEVIYDFADPWIETLKRELPQGEFIFTEDKRRQKYPDEIPFFPEPQHIKQHLQSHKQLADLEKSKDRSQYVLTPAVFSLLDNKSLSHFSTVSKAANAAIKNTVGFRI